MAENKTVKKNCTTIFMVPPFGVGRDRLTYNGFIGAYLGDVNKPDLKYKMGIYFLFKPEDMSSFEDFLYEEREERGMQIVEDYDYEGGYVVLIYLLEDRYSEDYEKFLKGEYSKFSNRFKNTFPKTLIAVGDDGYERPEISTQYRVFNKDASLKEYLEEKFDVDIGDMELWSKPNLEEKSDEYLDIIKIKGNV